MSSEDDDKKFYGVTRKGRVYACILMNPAQVVVDIAQELDMDMCEVSELVDGMRREGLIKRRPTGGLFVSSYTEKG